MVHNKLMFNFLKNVGRRFNSTNNLKMADIPELQRKALSEMCIVVNEKDEAIGAASKYDCHRVQPNGSLILHRAFSVFIFNSKGEIMMHKRSPGKVTYPGYVTNACCSHPLSDFPDERSETSANGVKLAARRRLNYELGIPLKSITNDDLQFITRLIYNFTDKEKVWGEHELDYLLVLNKDVKVNPHPDEISEIMYISKERFPSFIKETKDPITPWFRLIAERFLPDVWDNLNDLSRIKEKNQQLIHQF